MRHLPFSIPDRYTVSFCTQCLGLSKPEQDRKTRSIGETRDYRGNYLYYMETFLYIFRRSNHGVSPMNLWINSYTSNNDPTRQRRTHVKTHPLLTIPSDVITLHNNGVDGTGGVSKTQDSEGDSFRPSGSSTTPSSVVSLTRRTEPRWWSTTDRTSGSLYTQNKWAPPVSVSPGSENLLLVLIDERRLQPLRERLPKGRRDHWGWRCPAVKERYGH